MSLSLTGCLQPSRYSPTFRYELASRPEPTSVTGCPFLLRDVLIRYGMFSFPLHIFQTPQTLTNQGIPNNKKEHDHRDCEHARTPLLRPKHPVTINDIP